MEEKNRRKGLRAKTTDLCEAKKNYQVVGSKVYTYVMCVRQFVIEQKKKQPSEVMNSARQEKAKKNKKHL